MFSTPSINLSQFHIEPGMVVADLGCGIGSYTFEIVKRVGPTGKVFALDVQKNLIEKLANEAKSKNITNITALWDDLDDANGIGLKDNSIDRIIVANTLFQIEDLQKFVLEIKRILRPNGCVLFVDWSESFGGIGPIEQSVVKKERMLELCQRSGLLFTKDVQAGDHHYGFVVQYKV